MERRRLISIFVASAALLPGMLQPALGDDDISAEETIDIIFDEAQRVIIEEYFGYASNEGNGNSKKKNKGLPPGLAKRDQLPPGLARQIERNGTLPPGLQTYDLPPDLISRLPPAPNGTHRVIVGSDVVLIREGTRYILDVIKDVLTQ